MVNRILIVAGALVGLLILTIGGAIAFGGPSKPEPQVWDRNAPHMQVSRAGLPGVEKYRARDGAMLAYRHYPPAQGAGAERGVALLIHGSVVSGAEMHPLAMALSAAGIDTYSPDLRGHGESACCGDIAYVGQLEDDLADLLTHFDQQGAPERRLLIGHSAGGGFALRVASQPLGERLVGMVLLAPFLGPEAPTMKPSGTESMIDIGLPRIIALSILDQLGIDALGALPVLSFSIDPAAAVRVSPSYSYRLATNFRPHRDWQADISEARRPLRVYVGDADAMFDAKSIRQCLRPCVRRSSAHSARCRSHGRGQRSNRS